MLIHPQLTGTARCTAAAEALISATVEMAQSGQPLMRRVVPAGEYNIWNHYPPNDAIDAATGARWFYHAHPPEERDAGEHGHFHLFLDRTAFPPLSALAAPQAPTPGDAEVVHILALSIDLQGLPTRLFSVNRWVTDEWLHAAPMILERLHLFDVTTAGAGDPLVNRWLTAALAAFAPEVEGALAQRDAAIAGARPTFFENRAREILSEAPVDLQLAATRPDR
jgi:hypothetical protein